MPTSLVARAFERAVALEQPVPGLLHHSDRGSQYASDAYREPLCSHGVVARMSRASNCYDNAKMESFWATLKSALIQDRVFTSRAEAKSEIFWYIEVFYNRQRLHGALGYYSPVEGVVFNKVLLAGRSVRGLGMRTTSKVHVGARCGSEKIRKNGHTVHGAQRAKCLECERTFILEPKGPRYNATFKEAVVAAYQDRMSFAGIARTFGVCYQSVTAWTGEKN